VSGGKKGEGKGWEYGWGERGVTDGIDKEGWEGAEGEESK